jgi:hypothetical protein
VPLHPFVSGLPTAASWGLETQVGHVMPPRRGAPIIDHHDRIFPREGHHITFAWVIFGFHVLGEGPRDHETLHHATVQELVLGVVHVVRACG